MTVIATVAVIATVTVIVTEIETDGAKKNQKSNARACSKMCILHHDAQAHTH